MILPHIRPPESSEAELKAFDSTCERLAGFDDEIGFEAIDGFFCLFQADLICLVVTLNGFDFVALADELLQLGSELVCVQRGLHRLDEGDRLARLDLLDGIFGFFQPDAEHLPVELDRLDLLSLVSQAADLLDFGNLDRVDK